MNKRIKELAEQAWDSTRDEIGSFVDDGGEVNWDFLDTYDQKFAELIVRECAQIANGFASSNFGNGITGHQLLKHFGVEE